MSPRPVWGIRVQPHFSKNARAGRTWRRGSWEQYRTGVRRSVKMEMSWSREVEGRTEGRGGWRGLPETMLRGHDILGWTGGSFGCQHGVYGGSELQGQTIRTGAIWTSCGGEGQGKPEQKVSTSFTTAPVERWPGPVADANVGLKWPRVWPCHDCPAPFVVVLDES